MQQSNEVVECKLRVRIVFIGKRVQSLDRAAEIAALCDEKDWKVIVGVEPDKPEVISDLDRLMTARAG